MFAHKISKANSKEGEKDQSLFLSMGDLLHKTCNSSGPPG